MLLGTWLLLLAGWLATWIFWPMSREAWFPLLCFTICAIATTVELWREACCRPMDWEEDQ